MSRLTFALAAAILSFAGQVQAAGNFTFTATNAGTYTASSVTSVANALGAGGSGGGAYTMTAIDANGNGAIEAQIANGSVSGQYSAPYDTANHQITTNYFSTGTDAFNLTFGAAQKYLGLLVGSVDSGANGNLITFYNGATQVGTISGSDITSQPSGAQTAANSYYLNINFVTAFAFTSVVFSSQVTSFEFGNIVASTVNVPEPGMLGLFGLGALSLGLARRRRRTA